jgi:predicted Zn finger-like uncharacterized protein
MFKVVPDQLRVSEGWVRCGQCGEVFDANAHLQASAVAVPPPAAPPPPEQTVAEPFLHTNPQVDAIESIGVEDAPVEPRLDPGFFVEEPAVEPAIASADSEPGTDDVVLQHAFLRPSTKPARQAKRSTRIALALLSVLLGAVLVVQVALRERDWIAAVEPASVGILVPVCEWVGCTISPLRRIESVVIDSSSFTKVRADTYRLSFTLKNTAQLTLATPALELTLTNLQDQAVLKRVLVSSDFGDRSGVMAAGAELPVNLPLTIKLGTGGAEKISGYRLLSFYP